MSSLPKDAITGVVAGSLLTFSGDDRRCHAALPCFNHLPEIINSLEQHPLGILVASQKLIDVCSRACQVFSQSVILCLQHLFPSQACVKGVFKGGNPLRRDLAPRPISVAGVLRSALASSSTTVLADPPPASLRMSRWVSGFPSAIRSWITS